LVLSLSGEGETVVKPVAGNSKAADQSEAGGGESKRADGDSGFD